MEYPLPDQVYFPGPSHYPLRFVKPVKTQDHKFLICGGQDGVVWLMDHGDETDREAHELGYYYDELKLGSCLQRLELPGPAFSCTLVKVKQDKPKNAKFSSDPESLNLFQYDLKDDEDVYIDLILIGG